MRPLDTIGERKPRTRVQIPAGAPLYHQRKIFEAFKPVCALVEELKVSEETIKRFDFEKGEDKSIEVKLDV